MINVQKILMFIAVLLVVIGVSSCRTQTVVLPASHHRDSTHLALHRDSTYVYEKDSISFSYTELPFELSPTTLGSRAPQSAGAGGDRVPEKTVKEQGATFATWGGAFSRDCYLRNSTQKAAAPDTLPASRLPTIHHWHTRYRDRVVTTTDTITVTQHDSIPYPVEVPVEVPKPIPKFYRFAAWFTILTIVFLILYVFLRIYFRR